MNELKPCPFCGAEVQWCGDGWGGWGGLEPHDCDHIHCRNCNMHFNCEEDADKIEQLRALMLKKWNTRT